MPPKVNTQLNWSKVFKLSCSKWKNQASTRRKKNLMKWLKDTHGLRLSKATSKTFKWSTNFLIKNIVEPKCRVFKDGKVTINGVCPLWMVCTSLRTCQYEWWNAKIERKYFSNETLSWSYLIWNFKIDDWKSSNNDTHFNPSTILRKVVQFEKIEAILPLITDELGSKGYYGWNWLILLHASLYLSCNNAVEGSKAK